MKYSLPDQADNIGVATLTKSIGSLLIPGKPSGRTFPPYLLITEKEKFVLIGIAVELIRRRFLAKPRNKFFSFLLRQIPHVSI